MGYVLFKHEDDFQNIGKWWINQVRRLQDGYRKGSTKFQFT